MVPKPPFYQWYTRNWLASSSTRRMTLAARGLYREMLDWQFEDGSLPDDPAEIAAMVSAPLDAVLECWPVVRARFEVRDDGRLVNATLEQNEREYRALIRERSAAGRRGAVSRWSKKPAKRQPKARSTDRPDGKAMAKPMANPCPASASASKDLWGSKDPLVGEQAADLSPSVENSVENSAPASMAEVRALHDHFNAVRGGTRPLELTAERVVKYRARLKRFSAADLRAAISSALGDPFYRGDNDRSKRFDYPETVLKNDAAVDRHLDKAERRKPQAVAASLEERRQAREQVAELMSQKAEETAQRRHAEWLERQAKREAKS